MRQINGSLHNDIDRILIDETAIQRESSSRREISELYAGQDLLLISVLKGSIMFMADLCRAIEIPHEIDFMATSSYGAGMESTGVCSQRSQQAHQGRNIVSVEDIIDSGHTLSYLLGLLRQRQPASIRIVSLLDKPDRREVDIVVDWVGFSIPNEFVVGYGLDFDEVYRNLGYIGVLKPAVYSEPESVDG